MPQLGGVPLEYCHAVWYRKKLEWWKKFEHDYSFSHNPRMWHTDRHRMTAKAVLVEHRTAIKSYHSVHYCLCMEMTSAVRLTMVDMSTDDVVQLFTYDDAECLIVITLWEVCSSRWTPETGWDIVHAGFTVLFWVILTTNPTSKYCPTQRGHFWDTLLEYSYQTQTFKRLSSTKATTKLVHHFLPFYDNNILVAILFFWGTHAPCLEFCRCTARLKALILV